MVKPNRIKYTLINYYKKSKNESQNNVIKFQLLYTLQIEKERKMCICLFFEFEVMD